MEKKTHGLGISAYFGIFFVLTFIFVSILVIAIVNREMRSEALSDAREKTKMLLERNLATHEYFSSELKPKVFDMISKFESEDYFEPTWMSSTYAIRQIDKYFGSLSEYGYYYKECAINARYPQNEADDYERAFIEELGEKPELLTHSEIRKIDGRAYFTTFRRGEMMEESCLRCHSTPENAPCEMVAQYGSERSFNRNAGDVVSAISIRVPLAKAYAATRATAAKLLILLMVILSLMFFALYYFTKKIILQPLRIIMEKSSEISFDPKHLGDKIAMPYNKEFGEVVSAFNNMSVKLRDNRDFMEQKILQRTSQLQDLNKQLVVEIDDHKKTETEVRNQKIFLEQVIDSLSHPFYVLDANDYTIKLANSKTGEYGKDFERLTCYALSHNRTEPCNGLEHRCTLEEVKRTGQPVVLEHIHTNKEGVKKNIEVHGHPIFDSDGNVVQLIEYCLDITERKQVEEERENMAKFPSENPSPVLRVAEDGSILYSNDACLTLLGKLEWQVGGAVPDDWRQLIGDVLDSNRSKVIEVKSGKRVISFVFAPVVKSGYVNVYGRDMTEQKEAEQALQKSRKELEIRVRERTIVLNHTVDVLQEEIIQRMRVEETLGKSEEKYRELVENANSIIMRRNIKGEITFFNEFAQKFFGYSEDEILGRNVIGSIIPRTDSAGHDQAVMVGEISKYPDQYHTNENENIRRNGKRVWITWTNKPIRDKNGRVIEILAIGNDTTERKQQEKALQESETRLTNAQRIAHIGNWEWDIVNNKLWWSDEIYRIFGLKPQEFGATYEAFLSYIHPDDREFVERSVDESLYGHKPYSIAHRIIHTDGTERVVHERAEIIRDADKYPIKMIGTLQDVTLSSL